MHVDAGWLAATLRNRGWVFKTAYGGTENQLQMRRDMPRNWISRLNSFVARGRSRVALYLARADQWWIKREERGLIYFASFLPFLLVYTVYRYELTRIRSRCLDAHDDRCNKLSTASYLSEDFPINDVDLLEKSILFASRISFATVELYLFEPNFSQWLMKWTFGVTR